MKSTLASLLMLTSLSQLSGCFWGTMFTRGSTFVGAYPYEAIGRDVQGCLRVADQPAEAGMYFISIPIDLAVDSVLLVPDVILWMGGYYKQGLSIGSIHPHDEQLPHMMALCQHESAHEEGVAVIYETPNKHAASSTDNPEAIVTKHVSR